METEKNDVSVVEANNDYDILDQEQTKVGEILRALATNKYMPWLDYAQQTFGFQTLFYQSSYSYRCCTCAYEHEYVEYINENRVVNEEKYHKILANIQAGKCPHVENADDGFTSETQINAMHIAAALDTEIHINRICLESTIFEQDPCGIAMLKNSIKFLKIYQEYFKECLRKGRSEWERGSDLKYAVRFSENNEHIRFETLSRPEYCVKTKNGNLLKLIMDPFFCILRHPQNS